MFSVFSIAGETKSEETTPAFRWEETDISPTWKPRVDHKYKISCDECAPGRYSCTGGVAGPPTTQQKCGKCIREDLECRWSLKRRHGRNRREDRILLRGPRGDSQPAGPMTISSAEASLYKPGGEDCLKSEVPAEDRHGTFLVFQLEDDQASQSPATGQSPKYASMTQNCVRCLTLRRRCKSPVNDSDNCLTCEEDGNAPCQWNSSSSVTVGRTAAPTASPVEEEPSASVQDISEETTDPVESLPGSARPFQLAGDEDPRPPSEDLNPFPTLTPGSDVPLGHFAADFPADEAADVIVLLDAEGRTCFLDANHTLQLGF